MGGARDASRSRGACADRVGVRARQRAHRAAREPGRRRTVRPAGQLSQLVLRASAAALCGSRLRLPRVGPDDRERHQRQDHPTARRRRAVRHPLWAAAGTRACARPPRRHPRAACRVGIAGRRCRADSIDSARLVRPPLGCGDPVRGRAARSADPRRRPVGARGQRAGACRLRPIPAPPPRWKRRSSRRASSTATRVPCWCTPHGAAISCMAAGMDHVVEGPDGTESAAESGPDVGRLTVATELAEGARLRVVKFIAYGLVEPALGASSPRRGRRCTHCRPSHGLGRPARTGSAPTSTSSGNLPTSSWRATSSCSRPFGSRSSTRCRPAPAPSSARSPPRD